MIKMAAAGVSNDGCSDSADTLKEPFRGDQVLAKLISFMHDALISWECAYAIAEGDTGCVYKCLKASGFLQVFEGVYQ